MAKRFPNLLYTLPSFPGFHTFQCVQGCELSEDQTKRRYYHQEAYDGREVDRKAHEETGHWKYFRHEDCIEELKEYLAYGGKALQRKGEGRKCKLFLLG